MIINIKVVPGSKKAEIEEIVDMFGEKTLKVRVKSIPENGKANEELIVMLSKYFKVPQKGIKIIKGLASGNKIVEIFDK